MVLLIRFLRWMIRAGWPMRLLSPVLGRHNPFDPERLVDPYPFYHRLRVQPVSFSPLFRVWLVSGYPECAEVLRSPRFSSKRLDTSVYRFFLPARIFSDEFFRVLRQNLLVVDPPDHTRLRGLVNRAFTPRLVEGLRPRIQQIVDELLDAAGEAGTMDLVADLAVPLPVIVIAELMGVPPTDRARFKHWSDDFASLLDPLNARRTFKEVQASYDDFSRYFRAIFAERRLAPRSDLISALASAEQEGQKLSQTELLSICLLILAAGHETTTNLIGNAVVALLRHPDERARLQDDPALLATAIEEVLRYESPVQGTERLAVEDCELGGQRIRRGQLVAVLLGAANRDPRQFPDPDRLDLGRTENRHLAFGHGGHFCLGAQLARAEAQVAVGTLLRRFPRFMGPVDPPGWQPSFALRGPTALPLELRPLRYAPRRSTCTS